MEDKRGISIIGEGEWLKILILIFTRSSWETDCEPVVECTFSRSCSRPPRAHTWRPSYSTMLSDVTFPYHKNGIFRSDNNTTTTNTGKAYRRKRISIEIFVVFNAYNRERALAKLWITIARGDLRSPIKCTSTDGFHYLLIL